MVPVSAFCQAVTQGVNGIVHDQANRNAAQQAQDRTARQTAPLILLPNSQEVQATFPSETLCTSVRAVEVSGIDRSELQWLTKAAGEYAGYCIGPTGIDYILRDLRGQIIDRGYILTTALAPQHPIQGEVLHLQVVPGVVRAVQAPNNRVAREFGMAWPQGVGDLYQIRAADQATEQMMRIPGRKFHADLKPGPVPGESIIALQIQEASLVAGTVSVNDFAGATVGAWQGAATFTAQDVLGLNELLSLNYNGRLNAPDVPANSVGDYANFSIPYGWWTFGISGTSSRYQQEVTGSVVSFESLGTQKGVSVWLQRSLHRDTSSHTDVQLQIQRRWNRSYIDDTEIGLQHQDLTDLQVALFDTRNFRDAEFNTQLSYRQGLPTILGAQKDEPGRTSILPTSRYKIAVFDIVGNVPIQHNLFASYHVEARAQYGFTPLYGPDLFAVGGAYTVRGYSPDVAILDRAGWYVRQELASVPLAGVLQPFLFFDLGQASASNELLAGLGPGIKASWHGFQLMAYGADALAHPPGNKTPCCQLGLNISYSFGVL